MLNSNSIELNLQLSSSLVYPQLVDPNFRKSSFADDPSFQEKQSQAKPAKKKAASERTKKAAAAAGAAAAGGGRPPPAPRLLLLLLLPPPPATTQRFFRGLRRFFRGFCLLRRWAASWILTAMCSRAITLSVIKKRRRECLSVT